MSHPNMLTGKQIWFAEVRQLCDDEFGGYRHYRRYDADGGCYFNMIRNAKRWCERTLVALMAAGSAPQDLEAVIERGRLTWPEGAPDQREFIEDTPSTSFVGRSDAKRSGFEWTYDGDLEVKPHEAPY
jgi:hypothetical protein